MNGETRLELALEETLIAVCESLRRYWIKQRISEAEAEDLVHEGVVKSLLTLHKYGGKSSLKTFLVAVGKNAGYDYLRKEARQGRIKQRVLDVVDSLLAGRESIEHFG